METHHIPSVLYRWIVSICYVSTCEWSHDFFNVRHKGKGHNIRSSLELMVIAVWGV